MLNCEIKLTGDTDKALETLFLNAAIAARKGLFNDAVAVGFVGQMAMAICACSYGSFDLAESDYRIGLDDPQWGEGLSELVSVMTELAPKNSHYWENDGTLVRDTLGVVMELSRCKNLCSKLQEHLTAELAASKKVYKKRSSKKTVPA